MISESFRDVKETRNPKSTGHSITTQGYHFITFNGLLSGSIGGNLLQSTRQYIPKIYLNPTRIVGNMADDNVKITNNTINSTGGLQGIFASDGLFRNMEISSNRVNVQGDHTIVINGLLSGIIKGNTTNKPIKLLPLRIGGDANIYVVGFKAGTGYAYETISGGQSVDDRRTIPIGAFNYTDVDIPLFRSLLPNYKNNVLALMNRCGVRV